MTPDGPKNDDSSEAPPSGDDLLDTLGGELGADETKAIRGAQPRIISGEAVVSDELSKTQEIPVVTVAKPDAAAPAAPIPVSAPPPAAPPPASSPAPASGDDEEDKIVAFLSQYENLVPKTGYDDETRRLKPQHPLYCLTLSPEEFKQFAEQNPSSASGAVKTALQAGEGFLMVEIISGGHPGSKQIFQLAAERISELAQVPQCRELAADIIEDCLKPLRETGTIKCGIRYMAATALQEMAELDRDFVRSRFQTIFQNISGESDQRIKRILESIDSTDQESIDDMSMPPESFSDLLDTDPKRAINILLEFVRKKRDDDTKFIVGFGNFGPFLEMAAKKPKLHDDVADIIENALDHSSPALRFAGAHKLCILARQNAQSVRDRFNGRLDRRNSEPDSLVRVWLDNVVAELMAAQGGVLTHQESEDEDDVPTVVIHDSAAGPEEPDSTDLVAAFEGADPGAGADSSEDEMIYLEEEDREPEPSAGEPITTTTVRVDGGHTFDLSSPTAPPIAARRTDVAQKLRGALTEVKTFAEKAGKQIPQILTAANVAAAKIESVSSRTARNLSASIAAATTAIRGKLAGIKMPEIHLRKCTKREAELAIATGILVATAIAVKQIYNFVEQPDPPKTTMLTTPTPSLPPPPSDEPDVPKHTFRIADAETPNPRRKREKKLTKPNGVLVATCDYDEKAAFLCVHPDEGNFYEKVEGVPADSNNPSGPTKRDANGNPLVRVELVSSDRKRHWIRDNIPIVNLGTPSEKFDLVFYKVRPKQ